MNAAKKEVTELDKLEYNIRSTYGDYIFEARKNYSIKKLKELISLWQKVNIEHSKSTILMLEQMIIWKGLS